MRNIVIVEVSIKPCRELAKIKEKVKSNEAKTKMKKAGSAPKRVGSTK